MEDIINRIAEGRAQLLGIEDICTRLGISRSTFDRWQRNSSLMPSRPGMPSRASLFHKVSSDESGMTPFPPPDIRIGNSPKWEIETFKKWLRQNVQSTSF